MSKTIYFTVSFGSAKAGLNTVGYTVFDVDSAVFLPRTTNGVNDLDNGNYGALVTLPDRFQGMITWDTGEDELVTASVGINLVEGNCTLVQCTADGCESESGSSSCIANIAASSGCGTYGESGDIPTISLMHTTGGDVYFPITTITGLPTIIAEGAPTPEVCSGVVEAVLKCKGYKELNAELSSNRGGIIVSVPADLPPGVWYMNAKLTYNDNVVAISRGMIYIDPSPVFTNHGSGIPTISDIRQTIRDFPNNRRLLGTYEFTIPEIAGAVRRTISKFNSHHPKNVVFSSLNWPRLHSDQLIEGILSELFEMSAAYFRANYLPYSAGGITIDDTVKEKDYLNAANVYKSRWDRWCTMFKMSKNIEDSFGSNTSFYYKIGY